MISNISNTIYLLLTGNHTMPCRHTHAQAAKKLCLALSKKACDTIAENVEALCAQAATVVNKN